MSRRAAVNLVLHGVGPSPSRFVRRSSNMGMNEWVLVGTGFVLARVLYVWYVAPRKAATARRR